MGKYSLRGSTCSTMVSSRGCRGIPALVPGEPLPLLLSPLGVCRAVSLPLVFRRLFLTLLSLTPHGCAASEVPPPWLLGPAGAGMKQPRPCLTQEPCIPLSPPGLLQPKQHHTSPDYLELSILSSGMARDALIFTFLSF